LARLSIVFIMSSFSRSLFDRRFTMSYIDWYGLSSSCSSKSGNSCSSAFTSRRSSGRFSLLRRDDTDFDDGADELSFFFLLNDDLFLSTAFAADDFLEDLSAVDVVDWLFDSGFLRLSFFLSLLVEDDLESVAKCFGLLELEDTCSPLPLVLLLAGDFSGTLDTALAATLPACFDADNKLFCRAVFSFWSGSGLCSSPASRLTPLSAGLLLTATLAFSLREQDVAFAGVFVEDTAFEGAGVVVVLVVAVDANSSNLRSRGGFSACR
jgi:hypothetical protein